MDPMELGLCLPVACEFFKESKRGLWGWQLLGCMEGLMWGKLIMKLVPNCGSQIKAQVIHNTKTVCIPAPSKGCQINPKGCLKPFGTLWKVHWLYLFTEKHIYLVDSSHCSPTTMEVENGFLQEKSFLLIGAMFHFHDSERKGSL